MTTSQVVDLTLRCLQQVPLTSALVAGAGLEPAISAYETERITIFHIPLFCIRYGVRTRASAVKGQRVNHFTNRT